MTAYERLAKEENLRCGVIIQLMVITIITLTVMFTHTDIIIQFTLIHAIMVVIIRTEVQVVVAVIMVKLFIMLNRNALLFSLKKRGL